MLNKVADTIEKYRLLKKGEAVVVAVSGGADSMSLLHLLFSLGQRVHAVHIEHGIRGEESLSDAAFVQQYCQEHGIPFTLCSVDVPSHAKKTGQSMEEAARQLRYNALYETAARLNIKKIALAHNSNDQAETLLFRLVRGSGLEGLCAMQPSRLQRTTYGDFTLLRPLLFISRDEIESYCKENNINYRTDSTNQSLEYTRNYLRHRVMPLLYDLNPNLTQTLARAASLFYEDEECLQTQAKNLYRQIMRKENGQIILKAQPLAAAPVALSSRVIRQALADFSTKTDIDRVHIQGVLQLIKNGRTGKSINLPHDIIVSLSYGFIVISSASYQPVKDAGLILAPLKMDTAMDIGDIKIHARLLPGNTDFKREDNEEYLDFDALPKDLVLRHRQEGDIINPLGMTGFKKLKEYFIDKKVPRQDRERAVLLAQGSEVYAIIGYTVSNKAAVTPNTKRVLHIKIINGR